MPTELAPAFAFLTGLFVTLIASQRMAAKGLLAQQDILKHGIATRGRILRIWQPPLPGSFTRIHFEFTPDDAERPVQACHLDRRPAGELAASLPAAGTSVGVHYLPTHPNKAVISRLVSRRGP